MPQGNRFYRPRVRRDLIWFSKFSPTIVITIAPLAWERGNGYKLLDF
jgi:hypothetical protein